MRDPVDTRTQELPALPAVSGFPKKNEAPKRGRGRPRKPDALSAADRARRYRQRQALKRTMAEKIKDMNNGQKGRLRNAQRKGTLAFSVLCELTMSHLKFPPVTQL